MKNKLLKALIFAGFISIFVFSLTYCSSSTDSDGKQRLVIENGFYNKVETPNSNENIYAIEFDYYVKGEDCNWGGYSIQMDSYSRSLNLYKMQLLIADEKHAIRDTFTVNNGPVSNCVVKMQGYKIGSSDVYESLYAEYILQAK